MCDFFTASSDGGHQSRWTDSAKSFSAVLLVIWISLCHSIPQICHSPSLWLTVSYCIYISLSVRWRVHGKPACGWFLERPARIEAGVLTFMLKINTLVDEYHRDQRVCVKAMARTFLHFLARTFASVFLVLHSSARLWGAEQTKCDRGIFCRLVVWRCWIESRFGIFCPSKLNPL